MISTRAILEFTAILQHQSQFRIITTCLCPVHSTIADGNSGTGTEVDRRPSPHVAASQVNMDIVTERGIAVNYETAASQVNMDIVTERGIAGTCVNSESAFFNNYITCRNSSIAKLELAAPLLSESVAVEIQITTSSGTSIHGDFTGAGHHSIAFQVNYRKTCPCRVYIVNIAGQHGAFLQNNMVRCLLAANFKHSATLHRYGAVCISSVILTERIIVRTTLELGAGKNNDISTIVGI